jgi:hypothetical protein
MASKFSLGLAALIVTSLGIFSSCVVMGQGTSATSLEERLKADYKVTKIVARTAEIVAPGTVFVLQKDGVLAYPPTNLALCPSKFQDGALHPPGGFCKAMVGQDVLNLKTGEKVYITQIEVGVKNDKIIAHLIQCDACNGNSISSYKSAVIFQFPKGYLQQADAGQVEDVIAQVLAVDTGGGEAQQQAQNIPPAQTPTEPFDQPTKISLGQTPDEVKAVLGQPQKIVDLGPKQIYVYKDLKITFVDCKVADVQ